MNEQEKPMQAADDSQAQMQSASYRLPAEDSALLLRDEMRSMRFALEYAKAELLLRDWGIRSTIIVFGSSHVPSPELAKGQIDAAQSRGETERVAQLRKQVAWYEAARAFGRIASRRGGAFEPRHRWRDNVIATGGGAGIMEAANRGARETGAPTIGFNIELPLEQQPNAYTTPELTFRFHYFAMRKMHLAMRANALAIFPGGFGTMDELFEVLTLRQTQKAPPLPIVLFDKAYWQRVVDFDALLADGMVTRASLDLFDYADSPEELWQVMVKRGLRAHTPESGALESV